jgi:hypothetical protein
MPPDLADNTSQQTRSTPLTRSTINRGCFRWGNRRSNRGFVLLLSVLVERGALFNCPASRAHISLALEAKDRHRQSSRDLIKTISESHDRQRIAAPNWSLLY